MLKERERYWIAYYDTTNDDKGYNLNPGGEFCGFMRGSSNPNSKLTDEQVEEIIDLLKNSTKTQKEIAEIFNVSAVTIKRINNGVSYFDVNRQYPIRSREKTNQVRSVQTNINKTKLSEEQLKEVIKLLDETTISMDNIAKKFNICQSTISQINLGRGYAHLEGYEYPIRKSKFHKYN